MDDDTLWASFHDQSLPAAAWTHAAHAPAREAPLVHYSRDRLFSAAARAMFVTPDLRPLPV